MAKNQKPVDKNAEKVGGPETGLHTLSDEPTLIRMVNEYIVEAELARRDRIVQNKRNWASYWGNQDYSYKQKGQSAETLPKVAEAVEQFAAFTKRALTQFGDWFSVEVPKNSFLNAEQVRALMQCYLNKCVVGNKFIKFPTLISNVLKAGLLESLIVVKVHGAKRKQHIYKSEDGKKAPKPSTRESWYLRLDILPNEDYYPDPTTRGLYENHRAERDLVDVRNMADNGIYDSSAVARIVEDQVRADADRRMAIDRNQNETTPPSARKRVVIDECWGTLLNPDGSIYMENALCAIANGKYVIRKPEANPFWHNMSPMVAVPLVQTPFTVWGKALFDSAVTLNTALNELFNLMLDGGIAEVWGIRQVHTDWLEDPRQVSGGIPQGKTLAVNAQCPVGGKVVERVDNTGAVPQEAMAMFNLTDREFQAAAWTNDLRMGFLPPRQVKATEVTEASTNNAVIVDSFTSDLEHELIEPILYRVWMLIIQNLDDLAGDEVAEAVGVENAVRLARMSPAARHEMFAYGYGFKVFGLSATLAKARDFQKFMALMQAVGSNPLMLQAFMKEFSPQKAIQFLMKSLNINPEQLKNSPEEAAAVGDTMQQVQGAAQITSGTQTPSPSGGNENTNGEVNQNTNPSGGPA